MRSAIATVIVAAALAAGCSSSPESPWASDPDTAPLPAPTSGGDSSGSGTERTADAPGRGNENLITDLECFAGEDRCGVVAVPQVPGADDQVTIEFRVLSDAGRGAPLVQLLDGSGEGTVTPEAFPDRPIVLVGSRGIHPGAPNLSCPEFHRATTNPEFGAMVAECAARLVLAGIDPAGTVPTNLGNDVAAVIEALGYDAVDLLVPSWRALATPAIAARVDVRRVVYTSPWFEADRARAPAASALVSMDAVWAACADTFGCTAPGTVDDFLAAIVALDERPLDDVDSVFDEPQPIDADRLIGAILSNGDRPASLTFLPQLHQAVVDRDHRTVSAYVRVAESISTEVNLLGLTCSLFDPTNTTSAGLPSPLREHVDDGIDVFTRACDAWPSDDSVDNEPVPGLTLLTRSKPVDGADYATALATGPVVVEPTIGIPTDDCVFTAARAWFDNEEVDDSACTNTFGLDDRNETISLVPGAYDAGDVTIELDVPASWADNGYGTWWREADPIDATNLDVYLWGAPDAATARSQIVEDWVIADAELSSIQIGLRVWLLATGTDGAGSTYRVATADVDDENVAVILASDAAESERLADDVLIPALTTLRVS